MPSLYIGHEQETENIGISHLFLQVSVHRRHPLGSETVLLIVCSKGSLDWRVSSSLETIVVRRTRQRNTGSQCQLRMFDEFEDVNLQCLPQFWRRCRHTNHTALDQPCAASRKEQSQRDFQQHGGDESTFGNAHVLLAKHDLRFLEQEMQQKPAGEVDNISFRQASVKLRRTEIMNKTIHLSSNHCNCILSLAFMCSFPQVFVISLALETRVLFETRIGCEELPIPTDCFLFSRRRKSHTLP